jgi:hypothetical protein
VKTVGQSEAPLHCTSGGRGSTEPDHAATLRLTPEDLQEAAAITAVILAEGSSDIEILRKSLASLHPSRKTIFSFFDHRELSVDGGTSYLVKFLKAFAAARAALQIVAVFDKRRSRRSGL